MTHRPNSLGEHQKPYHCFGPTYLFVTCHSHYLQVKFQQYPTTFHILLCLSIFIYAFGIHRMPFLAYLPREYDPIGRANISVYGIEINHPISEHKYTMYTYLSHTSQNLSNMCNSPGRLDL